MAIIVPQAGQDIDATLFGAPVANQLNAIAPTAWVNVTYLNSWTTQTGMGPAQYRKEGDIVRLRGVIMGGALATVAFTLPVGFRPPYENVYHRRMLESLCKRRATSPQPTGWVERMCIGQSISNSPSPHKERSWPLPDQ